MSWAEATDPAAAYARQLLASHSIEADVADSVEPRSMAAEWAQSGAMYLTGAPGGPPRLVEGAPATTVRGALLALAALGRVAGLDSSALPGPAVLSERAAYMGLQRQGRVSPGGATRLLDAADGQVAFTLSRRSDVQALPALTSRNLSGADPWPALSAWVAATPARGVIERAVLLGLAAGAVDPSLPDRPAPSRELARPAPLVDAPLVVDLSALWAGPLCANLLLLLGARVVSVASTSRPDPTRAVAPEFHSVLRNGVEQVTLDLTSARGVAELAELVSRANIVIESSRPRALHQMGIDPAEVVAAAKACSWVSITAYGRAHNRIGYGDDVAAAAGLLATGGGFAGDALADPLTGTHAAVAALAGILSGRSAVLDVAMYDIARAARTPAPDARVIARGADWYVDDGHQLTAVRRPAPRPGA